MSAPDEPDDLVVSREVIDTIELRGLRVLGICGALPEERDRLQPLEIDLDVVADLARAGHSDELADTLDYAALAAAVELIITTGRFVLLEGLAESIAEAVLADPRARTVMVAVRKLRPPLPQMLDTCGVRITRVR